MPSLSDGGVPLDQDPVWGDTMGDAARMTFYPTASENVVTSLYAYVAGGDTGYTFQSLRDAIGEQLDRAPRIQRGTWQTIDVSGSDLHITRELMNYAIVYHVPETALELTVDVKPDMPWAQAHFNERVGREPVNPPPSHVDWPYHGSDKERHLDGQVFSHTYPERFWPKYAGEGFDEWRRSSNRGVRFSYGDLDMVVGQLIDNPYTRQAVLPVWFPEDTGATDRRVPCTLAYHFMADENLRLHMWYYLRACDYTRHFHNDVWFAARLLQWVCSEVSRRSSEDGPVITDFTPGRLNMTISSLHAFEGDLR